MGVYPLVARGEQAISGEVAGALGGVVPMLPLRRKYL